MSDVRPEDDSALRRWRIGQGLTLATAAARLGLGEKPSAATALHRYETGASMPKAHIIEAIVAATDGAVTAADIVSARARPRCSAASGVG